MERGHGTDPQGGHEPPPAREIPRRDWPGAELLSGPSPRAILDKLADGDPLGMLERCEAFLVERSLLLDVPRLARRALARIAHAVPTYGGEPPLDEWLSARIEHSVRELLDEDAWEEHRGIPPSEPWDPRYAMISEPLGCEPSMARRLVLCFNDLPDATRSIAYRVLVLGESVHRVVAAGHGPPESVKEHLRRALLAMSLLQDPESPPPPPASEGGTP